VAGCSAALAEPAGSSAYLHWVADYCSAGDYSPAADIPARSPDGYIQAGFPDD